MQTLYYKAQIFFKMDLRDLGYHYFGLTLKKQYEMDDYDLRDWCHNCISLSEYYTENGYYA